MDQGEFLTDGQQSFYLRHLDLLVNREARPGVVRKWCSLETDGFSSRLAFDGILERSGLRDGYVCG